MARIHRPNLVLSPIVKARHRRDIPIAFSKAGHFVPGAAKDGRGTTSHDDEQHRQGAKGDVRSLQRLAGC